MFRSFWVFAIAVLFSAAAGHAAASTGKPLSAADLAEIKSIRQDVMLPLLNNLNAAVSMVRTDPAKACDLAKSVETGALEGDTRTRALRDRTAAEGKDNSEIVELATKTAELVAQSHSATRSICNGDLGAKYDPATQAVVDKMMGLVSAFTSALTESANADSRGDTATACLRLHDADKALKDLSAYIVELSATGNAADYDPLIARVTAWKKQMAESLSQCPAQ